MAKSLHTPEYEYFCSLLIKARESAFISQVDLSLKLGRPQSFVSKYENGERRLDVIEFIQICMALEIEPLTIITDIQSWIEKRAH